MDRIWQILDGTSRTGGIPGPETVLLSLLLAFVLGQVLAWTYYYTHSGLSYSKSFVQSLILITIVVAMVMSVIGGSFVAAVGLMGALSIIRFRNIIRDTRDVAFVFCALVLGMAAGSGRHGIAIVGGAFIGLVILYLHLAEFGAHEPHNAFLRFGFRGHIGPKHPVSVILKRFCGSFTLISAQDSSVGRGYVEYAYQLMIRNVTRNDEMLSELEEVEGIRNVGLTMQEQLLEI